MSQRLCPLAMMMRKTTMTTMIFFSMFFLVPVSAKTGGCTMRERVVEVGVVLDANSKSGKMTMAAIEVACHDHYSKYKVELNPRYVNSDGEPGRALTLAEELIGREEVQVIVWLDTWREAMVLSEISRRSRIPIFSFTNGEQSDRSRVGKQRDELVEFRRKFTKRFHRMYGAGGLKYFGLSVNALKAYDCMTAIARSFDGDNCEISTRKISKAEFTGLSGPIDLRKAAGLQLWSPAGTKIQEREADTRKGTRVLEAVATQKLIIGVPSKTPFNLFVREEVDEITGKIKYVGFCIDMFRLALRHANIRGFDYEFTPHNGTYDELVEKVHNQTYGGAVGDITILSNRSREVEFTQPFMESSLSMIVPANDRTKSFLFAKPFTPAMWAASGGVLLYTVFIVWALEHGHNKEFSGPPSQQISNAMWFTFSSLFFAHREQVHNTLTRIVLVIWFFVALILTQSYTANLTSMLTLQHVEPSITTIEWLKANKSPVGCDPETFVCKYLVNVLNFDNSTIRGITDTSSYGKHFKNKSISALFLENPYEKAFFTRYCNGYVNTPLPYRFGGFGFVFPKNSPLADTFSEAILELSENGNISALQRSQFTPASNCIMDGNTTSDTNMTPSLGVGSFWVLYVVTIGTSTSCLVVFYIFFRNRQANLLNQGSGVGCPLAEMNTL